MVKEQNRISYVLNSKFYPLLLFFVSFVFVVLFSRSTSFLYIFEGADPALFKQMGLAILKGKTLYIDYFDNKGCILYFIHALGLGLGGDFIILLMQTFSLTATLIIWDKMLALYHESKKERLAGLSITLVLLLCFYGAGDQTQEWCLPYISYPLLIFLRSNKTSKEIIREQLFVLGLCFGIITFIQINNACAFLGFVAYLWIQYLLKKDYRKLFQSIGFFVLGWLIIAVPCVLYFLLKAGWSGVYEMVYASFLSNFEYIDAQSLRNWYYWLPYCGFVLSTLLLHVFNLRMKKDLLIPIFISYFLFIVTFGKQCNSFYLMAIIPLCVVFLMTFDFTQLKKAKQILCCIAILCAVFIGSIVVFHFVNDLILRREKEVAIYQDFHHCIENIPETERDSIFNYNLVWHAASMMQHEGLLQSNRVLFTYLTFKLPTLYKEETSKPPMKPKWILVNFDMSHYSNDIDFIHNNYELHCELNYDRLYLNRPRIGQAFKVCLYRRID